MYKKEACVLHQARAHQGWEEDLHHQTGRCLRWDMFPISVGVRGAFELPSFSASDQDLPDKEGVTSLLIRLRVSDASLIRPRTLPG